ncbi:hypothetical protein V6Z11_D09G088300 [Gossypium hirsutum]
MDLSWQFFSSSLVTAFLLTLTLAQQQPPYLYHYCSETDGNFTRNSTYETNLNRLLSSFSRRTAHENGFYNFSSGQGSNIANAIALCRGDVSSSDCFNCVNNANTELRDRCPNQIEASIWYDYSYPAFFIWYGDNVTDVDAFNQALSSLLESLRNKASSGTSLGKFATGSTRVSPFRTIYALAQCTPDLTQNGCSSCLSRVIVYIPQCCGRKQGVRVGMLSCNIRFDIERFYNLTAADTTTTGNNSNSSETTIIISISATAFALFLISGCIFIILRLRNPKLKPREHEATEAVDEIITEESLQYDFNIITAATDHFSDANKLGQGGFGAVYKGTLAGGKLIAVKRLSSDSTQGDLEFKNEVQLMSNLQHRNLVRLQGFSLEGKERLLIYEFVPNGSLDKFLFDPVKKAYLDWERRYKIIEDAEMTPKIADFGTARLCAIDQTHGATSRIMGTYGYMAPEYIMHGQFSVKSDVFSFGVLILEILSGQKNKILNGGDIEHLLNFAWRNWEAGTAFDLVGPNLRDGSRSELMRCIHIGLLCVQENVAQRPNMSAVVLMLTSYSTTLPLPSEPAFLMHSKTQSGIKLSGATALGRFRDEIAVASQNQVSC